MPKKKAGVNTHSRAHIHEPERLSDRIADRITGFVGSWLFVGIHTVWFILWILLRFEPFPFGLLTLMVSLEAIFLSTFVMMSQNRSGAKDHLRDDHEAKEVDELFKIQNELYKMQNEQTTILKQQNVSMALQTETLNLLRDLLRASSPQIHHPDLTPLIPIDSATTATANVNIRPQSHKKGTTVNAE